MRLVGLADLLENTNPVMFHQRLAWVKTTVVMNFLFSITIAEFSILTTRAGPSAGDNVIFSSEVLEIVEAMP